MLSNVLIVDGIEIAKIHIKSEGNTSKIQRHNLQNILELKPPLTLNPGDDLDKV